MQGSLAKVTMLNRENTTKNIKNLIGPFLLVLHTIIFFLTPSFPLQVFLPLALVGGLIRPLPPPPAPPGGLAQRRQGRDEEDEDEQQEERLWHPDSGKFEEGMKTNIETLAAQVACRAERRLPCMTKRNWHQAEATNLQPTQALAIYLGAS